MDGQILTVASLIAVTIGLWATGKLPEYLTALLFFAAAMLLTVAPPSVIFSGFASAAFWLVVSGYVIGIAISKTGLAARLARLLALRLANSYPRMVFGTVGLTYALAFVMPSNMGRIALLMPIVLAMADRAGFGEGRAGRIGLALAPSSFRPPFCPRTYLTLSWLARSKPSTTFIFPTFPISCCTRRFLVSSRALPCRGASWHFSEIARKLLEKLNLQARSQPPKSGCRSCCPLRLASGSPIPFTA